MPSEAAPTPKEELAWLAIQDNARLAQSFITVMTPALQGRDEVYKVGLCPAVAGRSQAVRHAHMWEERSGLEAGKGVPVRLARLCAPPILSDSVSDLARARAVSLAPAQRSEEEAEHSPKMPGKCFFPNRRTNHCGRAHSR